MPARMNLAAASPFGPIFGKEMRSTSRRKRSYFLRVGYLAFLLLFLIMVWTAIGSYDGGGVAWRQQRQAELGQAFFIVFTLFCVGAMGLIGPVLTATSVNSERLHRTLHVLMVTPINNWQIVSGKLLSRLLIAMTLIGLSLPVLALVRLLGGVELTQMYGVICLAFVTALIGASIGLFFSTFIERGYNVILLSYATMGFVYLFVPFIGALVLETQLSAQNQRDVAQVLCAVNPFVCAGLLTQPFTLNYAAWEWCVVVHLVVSTALVIWSAVILRRMSRRDNDGPLVMAPLPADAMALPIPAPPPPQLGIPEAAALPAIEEIDLPAIPCQPITKNDRGYSSTGDISDNPVLWRELRRPLMSGKWLRILGSIACVLLLITYAVLAANSDLGDRDSQIGFAFTFHTLILLIACVISATAIAQEKEGDTWTLLLTTPMSASEVILGKFWGILRRMLWPMALVVAHFGVFTASRVISFAAFCVVIWVIVTFNILWIATGILLSLCIRKVTFAVVLNLMLPIAAYAVVPIVLLIVGEWTGNGDNLAELVFYYLPYFYTAYAIDELPGRGGLDDRIYMPGDHYVTSNVFLLYVFAAGMVYLAVTGLLMWRTIVHFDGIVGRAQQETSE